jgi:hypothetical protein
MKPVWNINERTNDKMYTGIVPLLREFAKIEWRIGNIIKTLGKNLE